MTDAPNFSAAKTEPVAVAGTMPGTEGFTMAAFRSEDVPVGTPLYTHPQPSLSVGLDKEAVANIRKLANDAAKIAPGLWGSDIEKSEGEYGAGDETHTGFFVPFMETEHGKRLFDAHYCDVAEVHEDFGFDENGANHHAWDENSRVIFEFLAAVQPQNIIALTDKILALAAPAEGYVLVPVGLVNEAAGILDCEGYGETSRLLLSALPAAPTGGLS